MLRNMKLKKKLILSFLLVTVICSLSSVVGLYSLGLFSMMGGPQAGDLSNPTSSDVVSAVASTAQNAAGSTTANTDMAHQHMNQIIIMISIIAAAFILSVLVAIYISNDISKRIKEMKDGAQRLAEGNLDFQIESKSKDEIGQLGMALTESTSTLKLYIADLSANLEKMAQGDFRITKTVEYKGDFVKLSESMYNIVYSLNDSLLQISQAADRVFSGSDQVSSSAEMLAQGATEQASSIEELSASISEISEKVKKNAENASNVSTSVNNVSTELEKSNQHMQEMLTAIAKISNSSNEIGKIIKTIEDIAFQTNILALNAAVEAARAGAAGKGFAVVADEVRNLASKSADAAKNTTSLIQNSIAEVANGTKIADSTAKALTQVVKNTKDVVSTVDEIAQVSNEQANSISQITTGVDQISGVVQTNSATSEESSAASKELSEQAAAMKALVGKFKLKKQENKSAADVA